MRPAITVIDHANPAHQDWLRFAWGWLLDDPARYNHDGRYKNEAEFLRCPDGAVEWAIFSNYILQAIVTAHFQADATCVVHVTARPQPAMRALIEGLQWLEIAAFQVSTDIQASIPDLPAFDVTRKLARKMGYRKISNMWVKWFYE